MVGIIGAMELEVSGIKEVLENKKITQISGIEFVEGNFHGLPVVVAKCGVGKVFAAICAEAMIMNFHPDYIINTGVAGGLSKTLGIGDIAVATGVVQHDLDTSPLGDPKGLLSGLNIVNVPCDEKCVNLALEAATGLGIHCEGGTIATGDQFICSREQKDKICGEFPGSIACEMEGGSIGHVCFVNNVPFVVIRAISDNADGGAPSDFMEFCRIATKNNIKVMEFFAEKLCI